MSERIVRECDTCRAEITGAYYWTVAHSLTGNGPPGQSQDADREYCSRDCLIADQRGTRVGHVDCGCPRPMYGLRAWAT